MLRLNAEYSPAWPAAAVELIDWFNANRELLPLHEFQLAPWARVTDPELFYQAIATDIAAGPSTPSAAPLIEVLDQLRTGVTVATRPACESARPVCEGALPTSGGAPSFQGSALPQ